MRTTDLNANQPPGTPKDPGTPGVPSGSAPSGGSAPPGGTTPPGGSTPPGGGSRRRRGGAGFGDLIAQARRALEAGRRLAEAHLALLRA
ncbi:MAG: hypothetical protein ACXWOW_06370, partial [Candidatus Limnocylindrales bacterium]